MLGHHDPVNGKYAAAWPSAAEQLAYLVDGVDELAAQHSAFVDALPQPATDIGVELVGQMLQRAFACVFVFLSAASLAGGIPPPPSAAPPLPPFVALPGGGFGLSLTTPAGAWAQPLPLAVETVARGGDGAPVWTRGAYSAVNGASASGTLVSPGGSAFLFEDVVKDASSAGFTLSRTVSVVATSSSSDEYAFSTRLSLAAPDALAPQRRELFLPGVSYENASAQLPPGALAGDPLAAHILVREDRLPLPLALAFFPDAGGASAQLTHLRPDGSTIPNEDFTSRIVDAGLQFGSLGFLNGDSGDAVAVAGALLPRLSLAFQFPGSEGDRTYVYDPSHGGWANRSHPIIANFSAHAYTLAFSFEPNASSYSAAAQRAWRGAFAAFAPAAPVPAPAPAQLYRDGMELLAAVSVAYNGVPSVPFEAALPAGNVVDTSSQMGFVGRALPCAALLIYDAVVVAPNATRRAQAEAVVDLWAAQAMTPCGVAKTWYNIAGSGEIQWRASDKYQGSVRIMSDGMKGLLDAWRVAPRPAWLAAARAYGNFLLKAQAADGSVATAWDWDCAPLAADTRQTPHVVPFLVALFNATADVRFRDAAIAAGRFSAALFARAGFSYSGGAVDNPDVPDKEAGWLAAQAFIALFELTGDAAAWLAPAAQAAAYAETFVYSWNVPVTCAPQSPPTVYPCRRTTLGASIIATGQSGADNFMSIALHDLKRLGAWLGDAHFGAVGALLEGTTSQVVDWDASLGYAARGLMSEAVTLSVRRGAGVAAWLPWLTANLLQPIVQGMTQPLAGMGEGS